MDMKEKINYFYDYPELIQRARRSRTNYDYELKPLKDFVGQYVILENYVTKVKTKYHKNGDNIMMILRMLSDPYNPQSEPTYVRYKVLSSSKGINYFLEDLRKLDLDLKTLPLIIKIKAEKVKSGKGKGSFRCVLDTDMDQNYHTQEN